ncbi:MAG: hypothetical protein EXR65_01900 [Dehalococcoidia bacterium]|nr:hypothetical protein [Dehalococcoidia bacterium]
MPRSVDTPLSSLIARWRSCDSLCARVEQSIGCGTGLRRGEWVLAEQPIDAAVIAATTEQMLSWCCECIAETRRPYGIDQVALAVACAEPAGSPVASATFGVFRPVEFYRAGGVADRLGLFMDSLCVEELNRRHSIRFAAAFFSWGDVARDTIFRDRDDASA